MSGTFCAKHPKGDSAFRFARFPFRTHSLSSPSMSLSVVQCPSCGTQNISTAKFCGSCGKPLVSIGQGPPPSQAQSIPQSQSLPQQDRSSMASMTNIHSRDAWHEKAGLICGFVSIVLCGAIASLPGLYFSWSSLSLAKREGRSTTMSKVGLAMNGLGMLLTCFAIGFTILMMLMAGAASSGSGLETGGPDPFGL